MRHLQRPAQQGCRGSPFRHLAWGAADFAEALDADTVPHRSTRPAPPHRGDYCGQPICGPGSMTRGPPPKMFVYIDLIETHGPDGEAVVLARLPPMTNMQVYDIAKRSHRSVANHHGRTPS
jgi:hypothetical protein